MINVFTDGSADNFTQRVGGIGVYFYNKELHKHNISKRYQCNKCTNQKMELKACIKAIEKVIEFSDIKDKNVWNLTIYSDSKYVIEAITKYAPIWIKKGWTKKTKKDIKNLKDIKKLYTLTACYNVKYIHVNSHTTEPKDKNSEEWKRWYGNKMADKLANEARLN